MPLYEYYCADCQTKFDALRPMSKADADIQCKSCKGERTTRVLSLVASFTKESSSNGTPAISNSFGGGCCGGSCGCHH